MSSVTIVPPEGTTELREINYFNICANAKFIFDHTLVLRETDEIRMYNGQFFLVRDREEVLIDGRWCVVSS